MFGGGLGLAGALPVGAASLRVYVWVVALPCLILSTTMNLDLTGLGKVVATFVQWRAVLLGVALLDVAMVRRTRDWRSCLREIVEDWLALSWVSTVLVGLPMLLAVEEDPERAQRMSIGAAISSFVFQLPCQIVILEVAAKDDAFNALSLKGAATLFGLVVIRLLKNPVAWAICVGVTLSRTNGGDDVENDAYWRWIYETCILLGACATPLALAVTGTYIAQKRKVSSSSDAHEDFDEDDAEAPHAPREEDAAASIEEEEQEEKGGGRATDDNGTPREMHRFDIKKTVAPLKEVPCISLRSLVFLIIKVVVAPCLMYFLAQKNLNRRDRRAAVLLAATPSSSASVVIAQKYGLNDRFAATQALGGLVLLLPAVLAWSEIMDDQDLP